MTRPAAFPIAIKAMKIILTMEIAMQLIQQPADGHDLSDWSSDPDDENENDGSNSRRSVVRVTARSIDYCRYKQQHDWTKLRWCRDVGFAIQMRGMAKFDVG